MFIAKQMVGSKLDSVKGTYFYFFSSSSNYIYNMRQQENKTKQKFTIS